MKKTCIIVGMILLMILLVYGILAYCVFFYYEPRIEKEEARKEGWAQAIAEIEKECRQASDMWAKKNDAWGKQKATLEKAFAIEKSRNALLGKGLKGDTRIPSDAEWRNRSKDRLDRAQEALDHFANSKDAPKEKARIMELRQQLDALRARQQELQDLYEKRDKLMVWPLPLIAPYFKKETTQE